MSSGSPQPVPAGQPVIGAPAATHFFNRSSLPVEYVSTPGGISPPTHPSGWLFGAQGGGWEFPAFWTVALVVQALLGPGRWALSEERLPERGALTAA